ncbi:MAG: SH3 domain-containing protein [Saprospiraceae bacterium]|nr:SH3 domain-containing protein [Saprospiraceae bacterium]
MTRTLGIFFLFIVCGQMARADTAAQIIMNRRAAVTVSPVRLFDDSSYTKQTETTFTEGELVEVIGETTQEHLDNTQNQTFKWYKVRTATGQIGWIFGDNLAVVLSEFSIDATLRPFYKKSARFDNGFEKATVWVAGTNGHDWKDPRYPQDNPSYKEFYLVVTNERGKSVVLNYANESETSKKNLQSLYFQDLTENKIDEIIIETASTPAGGTVEERILEVYSFKAGALSKIFEERLTLLWEKDVPSPALSKFVEIEGSTIRMAYLDFIDCDKYAQGLPTDSRSKTQERCIEYVTYSFVWDAATRQFKPLYQPTRRTVQAVVNQPTILTATPSVSAAQTAYIQPNDRLQIIKHYENIKIQNGVKTIESWFYVKHPAGVLGYILAPKVSLKNIEHSSLLKSYYDNPPLMKQDWHSPNRFVSIRNP